MLRFRVDRGGRYGTEMGYAGQLSLVVAFAAGCGGTAPPVEAPVDAAPKTGSSPTSRASNLICPEGPRRVRIELVGSDEATANDIFRDLKGLGSCEPAVVAYDESVIYDHHMDLGHVSVKVARETLHDADGTEVVRYTVVPGPIFRLGGYDVYEVTAGEPGRAPVDFNPSLQPNDVFQRHKLARDLARLRRVYADRGHAYAEVRPKIDLNLEPDDPRVRLTIPISPGPVVHYHHVSIRGLHGMTEGQLLPTLGLRAGDRYSETALQRGRAELLATGSFSRVDVATVRVPERDGEIDVVFEVVPKPAPPPANDVL